MVHLEELFSSKALFLVKHCADLSYSNEMEWQVLFIFFSLHFRGTGYNDKAYLNSLFNSAQHFFNLQVQYVKYKQICSTEIDETRYCARFNK